MLAPALMAVVRQHANSLIHPKKEPTKPGCSADAMVFSGNPPRRHTPPGSPIWRLYVLTKRRAGVAAISHDPTRHTG
jgi:hypothetical protein